MMVEIGADSVLDYALFNISSAENSYEVFICKGGKFENLACGPLDQLAVHLVQVKQFQSNSSRSKFKLELSNNVKSSSWFTKFTLTSFLGIINSVDAVRTATAIVNEMSQLEDTRMFHLSLYFKSHPDHAGDTAAGGHFEGVGPTNTEIEAEASDATKNELLRAVELRIVVLKEELVALFSQAAGATLSVKHLSDLAKFSQHFQVRDLRDPLSKYLSLISEEQLSESSVKEKDFDGSKKNPEDIENILEGIYPSNAVIGRPNTSTEGISPAKIAQAEQMSWMESDNSSESTDEDQTVTERSRPIMRSVTPRRSASPMRRVQIGRSGSRRSTALSIKSLCYFPAREKTPTTKDADENNSGDERTDQPAKKSENTVRRMSVQEAISLFESKQKDSNSDAQKRGASGDNSGINNKTVLRRWSSGLADSLTHSPGNASEPVSQSSCALHVAEDNKMTDVSIESYTSPANLNTASETAQIAASPKIETAAVSKDGPSELLSSQTAEIDGAATSTDWSNQKEAELSQMLMKMIDSKPRKRIDSNTGSGGSLPTSNKQRGGFYSQYKLKRDEKLRAENANKHLVMEQKLKVLQETLKPSKTELASKSGVTAKKFDSLVRSQRPRRNSSPPVLQKKEISKLEVSKKASVKPSSLSTTRASWSSGSLPKTSGAQPVKSSSKVSSDTTPSRRKSQPVSPTPPSPKIEKPLHQPTEEPETNTKQINRVQGEKKYKTPVSTKITVKAKNPTASPVESGSSAAKPSFYDKVTKKGSVVPLEAKSARKISGIGQVVGRSLTKPRIIQSDASSKKSGNFIQVEDKEQTPEIIDKLLEADLAEQANDLDANLVTSLDNCLNLEKTETGDQSLADEDVNHNSLEIPVTEIQLDEDISISSAAWVEPEQHGISTAYETGLPNASASSVLEPSLVSSPRVRHSLSQMLQADSNEPDVIEWGNTENPPALIYHKDAPKGLKRLLKFARKSKGEANVTGYASPSVNSEGEDDAEDPKAACKKNFDMSRRTSLQEKRYSQLKTMVIEGLLDGNSSKRAGEYQGVRDVLSGSSGTTSTKARSFFSISTFRSSKSNETKPR